MYESYYFENPFFSRKELECKGTGALRLSPGFLGELIHLRRVMDLPMIVTSCCRSPEHNKAVGGHPNSLHLTEGNGHGALGTLAIDILTKDEEYRMRLIDIALELGWSVGYGKGFLHLDKRIHIGLPQTTFNY